LEAWLVRPSDFLAEGEEKLSYMEATEERPIEVTNMLLNATAVPVPAKQWA
jgi:hypothetical protein